MQNTLNVATRAQDDWVDITDKVARVVAQSEAPHGLVHVFVPHTTAGITLQENADPPLRKDIHRALAHLFPRDNHWQHCEDNAASHMKTVVTGNAIQVPFDAGRLLLGQWQSIYLCEYDGPRQRRVIVTVG